jgi:acyl dehydratase
MEDLHAELDLNALDRWVELGDFSVDPRWCRRYAAATNDTNPKHVSGELAPPIFAVVATVPPLVQALHAIIPEESGAFDRNVHGGQDMRFHRPLVPGTTVRVRVRPIGILQRPTGTAIVTYAELRDLQGPLVQEQYFTSYLRGVFAQTSQGADPPDHRMPAGVKSTRPVASVRHDIDPDQTYRYADATGDYSAYHVDDDAARAAGFPGIFLHGLCTMAFVSRAVVETVCEGDPARLRRLAVRFSRPVFPSESIITTIWNGDQRDKYSSYWFETVNPASQPVITHGLAEVRSASSNRL